MSLWLKECQLAVPKYQVPWSVIFLSQWFGFSIYVFSSLLEVCFWIWGWAKRTLSGEALAVFVACCSSLWSLFGTVNPTLVCSRFRIRLWGILERTEKVSFRTKTVFPPSDIRMYSLEPFAINLWYIPMVSLANMGVKGLKLQLVKAIYLLLVLLQQNSKIEH